MYRFDASHHCAGLPRNVNVVNYVNMIDASPRSRRRARTSASILEAARACAASGGIDGLTLHAVADRLDLSAAALYRYFPNKGALLAAVNAEILREQRLRLEAAVGRAALVGQPDPLTRLLVAVEATVALSREKPDDFGLLVATLSDPRTLVEDPTHAVHIPELLALLAQISGSVDRAAALGLIEAGPARDRAMGLMFAVLGALQTRKLGRFDLSLDADRLARRVALDLIAGWGARREDLDVRLSIASDAVSNTLAEMTS